jgi:hypothetical protein
LPLDLPTDTPQLSSTQLAYPAESDGHIIRSDSPPAVAKYEHLPESLLLGSGVMQPSYESVSTLSSESLYPLYNAKLLHDDQDTDSQYGHWVSDQHIPASDSLDDTIAPSSFHHSDTSGNHGNVGGYGGYRFDLTAQEDSFSEHLVS